MDQLVLLQAMTDETDETILQAHLDNAESIILNKLYPFDDGEEHTLPSKYQGLQTRISAYMLNKRGAEGESSHQENGVYRLYGSSDIPKDMLNEITPYGGVIG